MFAVHQRPSTPVRTLLVALIALILMSAGSSGCSHLSDRADRSAEDPGAAGRVLGAWPWDGGSPGGLRTSRAFYPLAVGNRWDYVIHGQMTRVTPACPEPPSIGESPLTVEITGTERIGTSDQFVQFEHNPLDPHPGPLTSNRFSLRQDRGGLFESDLDAMIRARSDYAEPLAPSGPRQPNGAPADPAQPSAPQGHALGLPDQLQAPHHGAPGVAASLYGGPMLGEQALLRYPLRVGAHWSMSDLPPSELTVVARERLALPAGVFEAWRLRLTGDNLGPNDRVTLWYSSAGLIRLVVHTEQRVLDPDGNLLRRFEYDWDQVLTRVRLVGPAAPGGFVTARGQPLADE